MTLYEELAIGIVGAIALIVLAAVILTHRDKVRAKKALAALRAEEHDRLAYQRSRQAHPAGKGLPESRHIDKGYDWVNGSL